MSLQVDWSEPARRDLEALPDWRLAATVDRRRISSPTTASASFNTFIAPTGPTSSAS